MAYRPLILDPQIPARAKQLVHSLENHFFVDVHTMLRLPEPASQLTAGCNFAITQVLAAAVSGISVTLYSHTGGSGMRFRALLKDFYPWDVEPGNAVTPDAGAMRSIRSFAILSRMTSALIYRTSAKLRRY